MTSKQIARPAVVVPMVITGGRVPGAYSRWIRSTRLGARRRKNHRVGNISPKGRGFVFAVLCDRPPVPLPQNRAVEILRAVPRDGVEQDGCTDAIRQLSEERRGLRGAGWIVLCT